MSLLLNKWVWIAIAFALLGAYAKYEGWQAERYRAQFTAAQQQVRLLGVQIADQNEAVKGMEKAAADAQGKAKVALQRAQATSATHEAGLKRLEALAASKDNAQKGCGTAWQEIRK